VKTTLQIAVVCVLGIRAGAQGTFQNLDFEDATIAPTPVGGWVYPANPLQAFPDWTVGGHGTVVMYNDLSTGSPAISLMGPDFPNLGYTPLQGSYSVVLQYFGGSDPPFNFQPPTLSQTGTIPGDAESINFLVGPSENNGVVEINGTSIPLNPIAGGRLAGDISEWAGQSVQLTFTTPSTGQDFFYFDDVNFSTTAVPEPDVRVLFCIAILGIAFGSQIWRCQGRLT
jgi:hypothetical protein